MIGIALNIAVYRVDDGDMDCLDFATLLAEFCEAHGLEFGGILKPVDENGDVIKKDKTV